MGKKQLANSESHSWQKKARDMGLLERVFRKKLARGKGQLAINRRKVLLVEENVRGWTKSLKV